MHLNLKSCVIDVLEFSRHTLMGIRWDFVQYFCGDVVFWAPNRVLRKVTSILWLIFVLNRWLLVEGKGFAVTMSGNSLGLEELAGSRQLRLEYGEDASRT